MYKKILIPVVLDQHDTAPAPFEAAKALADDGATFLVLHVMEAIPRFVAAEIPEDTLTSVRQQTKESLEKLASALPGATPVLISGHSGRTIVDYAEQHDVDCIVVASHRPGLGHRIFGSTADYVVRHANCAVHVIR